MNQIFGKNSILMNILVTGSNGFLGKTIVEILKKEHKITTLARSSGDYQLSLDKQVPNFEEKFNLIIHSAGKAHSIPKTEIEKKQFYQVNVIGTQNLLKGLEKSTLPQQFVFISSVAVYGKEKGTNITEESPLNAKDPYGMSKIEAEKFIFDWCQKNNVICTILRLPLLVGPNPPGNLGAMVKAINKGYYFNIGGGFAKKSMVLTEDVAKIIPFACQLGGVFNLTDGNHPNFSELSNIIAINQKKNKPLNMPLFMAKGIGFIGDLIGDKFPINTNKVNKITADLIFDDSKAREVLGWEPKEVLKFIETNEILNL